MSMNVTVSLPDEVYRQAEHLAKLTGCDLPSILADTLAVSLSVLGATDVPEPPLSAVSDAEVLALSQMTMDPVQDERLSELLDRQQAGELRADERVELVALMQVYQEGTLRKAHGLSEAVRRGLREPLDP
jgi:hypothetical protein